MASPVVSFERLRADLFRYYDTPFRVRLETVTHERRELLDRDGVVWREPWIEVIRQYAVTGLGAAAALSSAGAPKDLQAFSSCGLLDYEDIYVHQRDALQSCLAGRNVAIVAGTRTRSGSTNFLRLHAIGENSLAGARFFTPRAEESALHLHSSATPKSHPAH